MGERVPDSERARFVTKTGKYGLLRNIGPATSSIPHVTISRIQPLLCESYALMLVVLDRGLRFLFSSLALGTA